MAPTMPNVVARPDTNAKRLAGNQLAANFSTPTKAKAEPKPIKKRPAAAIQNTVVEAKIKVPIAQDSTANVKIFLGP